MTTKIAKSISFDGGNTIYTLKDDTARSNIGNLTNLETTSKTNLVAAINELNSNQNNHSYFVACPAITPIEGMATWNITHNLGTQHVKVTLYADGYEVQKNVNITSNNAITLTFPATSAVTAGDYSVLILADGSVDNPSSNFIPANTIINVKLDGSGDFTNLADAIAYLTGKYSNGKVIIQLGEGTFTFSDNIHIDTTQFNFSQLIIQGVSKDTTILNRNTWSIRWDSAITVYNKGVPILFQNLTLKGIRQDDVLDSFGFNISDGTTTTFKNVKIMDFTLGIETINTGLAYVYDLFLENLKLGLQSQGGKVDIIRNVTITATNITTLLSAIECGLIRSCSVTYVKTNVTQDTNITVNTIANSNLILKS